MDKVYRRYADSKRHDYSVGIARYMRAREQSAIDNYIQQKKEIREYYMAQLDKKAEQREIDRVAKEIVKAVDEVVKG